MADTGRLTAYSRVGHAFIDSYALEEAGHIENFQVEEAVIEKARYGQGASCFDGTPAPMGMNIEVRFNPLASASRTFTDADDIIDFMRAYGAAKPGDMDGRRVRTYNLGVELYGLEPLP